MRDSGTEFSLRVVDLRILFEAERDSSISLPAVGVAVAVAVATVHGVEWGSEWVGSKAEIVDD